MTVSTSLLARYTTHDTRAMAMGRLSASTTAAWIAGPSIGALLYKHVDPHAPALAASALFLVNSALAAVLLPADIDVESNATTEKRESGPKEGGKFASFGRNLKACFGSSAVASVVISSLLTASYAQMASFYEEKYGLEPHYRGYIKSFQQGLNLAQSFFAACLACILLALATLCEVHASFAVFLCIICPAVAVSVGTIGVSLESMVTQVTPKDSIGSVLAALDVLRNKASVTVPFYRTFLFSVASYFGNEDEDASMVGDPNPKVWLLSSFLHWTVFAVVIYLLLLPKAKVDDVGKKNI
ncbi:hypothetical protein ACHAWF_003037 [Thalassiosira exigua]